MILLPTLQRISLHTTMRKQIQFTRTDGSHTTWPTCGRTADGGSMDHLRSNSTHVAQFLEKLASYLGEYLNYPGK